MGREKKKRPLSTELSFESEPLEKKIVLLYAAISFIPLITFFGVLLYYDQEILFSPNVMYSYLLILTLSIVGYIMLRRIIHRLLKVVNGAQMILSGNLSARVQVNSNDEIGELATVFNQMAERLEESIEKVQASKQLLEDVLMKIGEGLAGSSTIDSFLELMVNTITQSLDARAGRLWLINEETDELYVQFSVGVMSGPDRIKVGDGIEGWVAKEKKPICLPRRPAQKDSLLISSKDDPTIICVPLVFKDKAVGVLSVIDKYSKDNFTEDDLLILNNIGAQTAIALENMRLNSDVEKTYMETLSALAMAVEAKDPYSRGHSKRVSEYAEKIAVKMGLPEETIILVRDAADMHDIGKIGISDEILHKPGPLTEEERAIMNKHPVIGEGILKPVRSLRRLCDAVRHHHEWLDGSGYPDGLKGGEISIEARVLCVADVYDALTSDRPYRKAMSVKDALAEIGRWVNKRYDKEAFTALCQILKEEGHNIGDIFKGAP